ncbi:MAG: hypothetical protein M4579_007357 [Chaenotheca gracillima]|nr:MAG: hypothetical protein M4579_007357 [Chaenotheca gracillima]
MEGQGTSVDDIATDDKKLEENAAQPSGSDVVLDREETVGPGMEFVDPMTTLVARPLLRGEITFSEAKDKDVNILKQLTYVDAREKFFLYLARNQFQIEAIVARHLWLSKTETCSIPRMNDWLHGSFNVGIPVTINGWREHPGRRVLIRFPLPYKIGESFRPGNVDEKLRCEAATYAWVDENCPDVPIPHLWGFALSDGRTFAALEHAPLLTQCINYARRCLLKMFGRHVPSQYFPLDNSHKLGVGYLLTDFIEARDGVMLSETWEEQRHNKSRRANLFKDLSRIILSLGRTPLPRLGSFTVNDRGILSLTNRPLTMELHRMENEGIPIDIPRDVTYSTTELYIRDLLHCYRTRLTHQPNAIHDENDGLFQIAGMTVMEMVLPHFFDRRLRYGPFALTLTDLHHSNIFVDENWRIKWVVDLEWACARSKEMQHPPSWLTTQHVDDIVVDDYDPVRQEFMDAFQAEETRVHPTDKGNNTSRWTDVMRKGWENGNFWYCLALDSPTALPCLLYRHIKPIFQNNGNESGFQSNVSRYWMPKVQTFIAAKVEEKSAYEAQLRGAFEFAGP